MKSIIGKKVEVKYHSEGKVLYIGTLIHIGQEADEDGSEIAFCIMKENGDIVTVNAHGCRILLDY